MKQQTPPEIFHRYFLSIQENYNNYHKVYIDTSKTKEEVGIPIILKKKKIVLFKLSNKCSIFTNEAIAILESIIVIVNEEHSKYIVLGESKQTQAL